MLLDYDPGCAAPFPGLGVRGVRGLGQTLGPDR